MSMGVDPTAIDIATDPTTRRMKGVAFHGNTPFDVPFISEVGDNLWQGGCETGLLLPGNIRHVVSLYPWERYRIKKNRNIILSELYVEMFDSEDQGVEQVEAIARWVNECRQSGPVLVHCQAGLNRSSLVAARALFLSGSGGCMLDGDEIVAHLRAARSPAALCNPAFEAEVRSWS